MNRRDLIRLLLAAPIATALDVEKLLWVPKPIVTVPAMPLAFHPKAFAMAMEPFRVGDIFTIEGRYAVNPSSGWRLSSGTLQEWRIQAVG